MRHTMAAVALLYAIPAVADTSTRADPAPPKWMDRCTGLLRKANEAAHRREPKSIPIGTFDRETGALTLGISEDGDGWNIKIRIVPPGAAAEERTPPEEGWISGPWEPRSIVARQEFSGKYANAAFLITRCS